MGKLINQIKSILLILLSLALFIIVGYWAYRYFVNEADTLIILSNKSSIDTVDINVFVDGRLVIADDILRYDSIGFRSYKRRLNFGFHNVEIRSIRGDAVRKTRIFCYYIHYIVIEFFDDSAIDFSGEDNSNNHFFFRKSLLPFRAG